MSNKSHPKHMQMSPSSNLWTYAWVFGLLASFSSEVMGKHADTVVLLSSNEFTSAPVIHLTDAKNAVNLSQGLNINATHLKDASIAEVFA